MQFFIKKIYLYFIYNTLCRFCSYEALKIILCKLPFFRVRFEQIYNELRYYDLCWKRLALINMISRVISTNDDEIIKLVYSCIENKDFNIRWLISSLDTLSKSKNISKFDKLFLLTYSIHLNTLKFILLGIYSEEVSIKLDFGLTSFNKKGDLFFNQIQSLRLNASFINDMNLKDLFYRCDKKITSLLIEKKFLY